MGKLKFKYGMHEVKGNLDDLVVYYSPYWGRNIARRYVKPKASVSNARFKSAQQNAGVLWRQASEEYKRDLQVYGEFYYSGSGRRKPSYALFLQMLWNWQQQNPQENLAVLTIERIRGENLPLRSVRLAIAAGLLENIRPEGIGENSL